MSPFRVHYILRHRLCVAWTDKDGFAEPQRCRTSNITGPALFCVQKLVRVKKVRIFAPAFETNVSGVIAQLVEQRTENPCVPGSIPGGTTKRKRRFCVSFFLWCHISTLFYFANAKGRPPAGFAH